MNSFKTSSVLQSLVLLMGGAALYTFLSIGLMDQHAVILAPLWVIFLIGIFSGVWMHASMYLFMQNLKIDPKQLASVPTENPVSAAGAQIGHYESYYSTVKSIFILVIGLVIALPFAYAMFMHSTIRFTPPELLNLCGVIAYLVVLRPLAERWAGGVSQLASRYLPSFSVEGNIITIDLNYRELFASNKKFIVKISFDELQEIRALSFSEATALIEFRLATDLSLIVASLGDQMKYLKGQIVRPNYYTLDSASAGTTLLLRGPNLMYVLPVGNINCNDLVLQFSAYKSKKV